MTNTRHPPRWRPALLRSAETDASYDWLVRTQSLTAAICRRASHFNLKLVRQTLGRPLRDEREPLGLAAARLALIREILLCDGDTPLVYARTVIPQRARLGPWRHVRTIGNRSLGSILFADRRIRRERLQVRRLGPRDLLQQRAVATAGLRCGTLYARRAIFTRAGCGILVTEVFLPGLLAL